MRQVSSHALLGATVFITHVAALIATARCDGGDRIRQDDAHVTPMLVTLIDDKRDSDDFTWDTVPLPELWAPVPVPTARDVETIRFEDDEGTAPVIGSTSAPRILRTQRVDLSAYAKRAGLLPGQIATVVLGVEILPDGTAGRISVERGSAVDSVDAIAIDYVRALRWVPATRGHQAVATRILFPVVMAVAG